MAADMISRIRQAEDEATRIEKQGTEDAQAVLEQADREISDLSRQMLEKAAQDKEAELSTARKEAEAIRRQADEEAEKVCASITAAAVAKREEAVRAAASLLLS